MSTMSIYCLLHPSQEVKGFLFVSLNSFLISISGIFFSAGNLNSSQMVFLMAIFGLFLGTIGFAAGNNVKSVLTKKHLKCLIAGSILGWLTLLTYYLSMYRIGPSGAVIVSIFACIVTAFIVEKFQVGVTIDFEILTVLILINACRNLFLIQLTSYA